MARSRRASLKTQKIDAKRLAPKEVYRYNPDREVKIMVGSSKQAEEFDKILEDSIVDNDVEAYKRQVDLFYAKQQELDHETHDVKQQRRYLNRRHEKNNR